MVVLELLLRPSTILLVNLMWIFFLLPCMFFEVKPYFSPINYATLTVYVQYIHDDWSIKEKTG